MSWETVIGLEIHTQLATASKIFSNAPTAYGALPNTQACAVDLGLPGVLPVLNEKVIEMAVLFGLAVNAEIPSESVFARKNYFYPDLPKGYQISQFEAPIVGKGAITITLGDGEEKVIGITRAHLEEDAGKSVHDEFPGYSGIDLNRAGTPLLEIVSEPEMRSAQEASAYMRAIHSIVTYLEICDGNMQEGSFRCDANVSVRPFGQEEFGTRTEIKNINSFKFVERAIEFEVERQIDVIESGGTIVQETRLYDADKDETRSMRSKEDAHDYRYFPDPDLLPIRISEKQIESFKRHLPELPEQKRKRYVSLGLNPDDARLLSENKNVAGYFESCVEAANGDARSAANWITGEVFAALNRDDIDFARLPIEANSLAKLINRINDKTISSKIAKQVFDAMWSGDGEPDEIIEAKALKQVTDAGAIEALIDEVLANNPDQIEQYKAGKSKVFGFFVGQVMKMSKGKANPQQVNDLLKSKLD
ncbi:MAG: Asp-tRNA(Asn)/Glu-tRNA(Gln) amidotransferase subunit GatB [Gammaproteobacteria bacterium]